MANTTYEIQTNDAANEASVAKVDMKLEIVVSACGGRPWRARKAHRAARCELGRLVCRLYGGGEVR
jgi:hypothetical protein